MPPNKKGGKGYKKGKGQEREIVIQDRTEGQYVARVVRALGNRNMLCFCEDNRLRICKLRGKIRHSEKVEVGDLVITSFRTYDSAASVPAPTTTPARGAAPAPAPAPEPVAKPAPVPPDARGDILVAYAREQWSKLKKEPGMNLNLFLPIESMEGVNLSELGRDKSKVIANQTDDMGGFEFDRDGEDEEEDGDESGPEELRDARPRARGARQAAATAAEQREVDDNFIDGI